MDILAVVTINKRSDIPKDAVQNQFAFSFAGTPGESDFTTLTTYISSFYDECTGPSSSWLAACIATGTAAHDIEYFDLTGHLDGSPHGVPIITQHFTITNSNTTFSLPNEVAVCLSFRAAYGSDVEFGGGGTRPRSSDRGRVFIGPLGDVSLPATSTKEARVWEDFREAVVAGAEVLIDAAADDWTWCVWSRTDEALKPVVAGWVDDAFDTQRRRGVEPTERTTFNHEV